MHDRSRLRGYPLMLTAGVCLNLARGTGMFVGAYALSAETGSLAAAEVGGALYFLPMLCGSGFRRIPVLTRGLPLRSTAMRGCLLAALVVAALGLWMLAVGTKTILVLVFMLILGLGNLINLSTRLPLLQLLVGEPRSHRFMAIEAVSASAGALVGPVVGGFMIAISGVAPTVVLCAALLVVAAVTIRGSGRVHGGPPTTLASHSWKQDVRLLRQHPALRGVLVVTVLMNTGFFAALPVVPYFAQEREMGPIIGGWLAAMIGLGSVLGALVLVVRPARRPGLVYVVGTVLGLVALGVFAVVDGWAASFVLLAFAGIGQAGFTVEQPVLTLSSVAAPARGAAMGLLSVAVGTLPLGVALTRVVELLIAPPAAVAVTCLVAASAVPIAARQSGHRGMKPHGLSSE